MSPPAVDGLLLSRVSCCRWLLWMRAPPSVKAFSPIRGLRLIASRASAYRVGVSMRPLSPM